MLAEFAARSPWLIGTVQDRIGSWFGVSGGIVLLVGLFAFGLWCSSAEEKAKKSSEEQKVREQLGASLTGSGHLPNSAVATLQTQFCVDGQHNLCSGRVAASASNREQSCTCTCHAVPISRFCGELGRHDLCHDAVAVSRGVVVSCGCTCHDRMAQAMLTTRVLVEPAVGISTNGYVAHWRCPTCSSTFPASKESEVDCPNCGRRMRRPGAALDRDTMSSTDRLAASRVSEEPAGLAPAGWYADPCGRHELRRWDGQDWTEYVSRAGQLAIDPPVA